MRVLQAISFSDPIGGAEKSVIMMREALVLQGHDVCVVSARGEGTNSDFTFPPISHQATSPRSIVRRTWNQAAGRCVREAVRQFKPDVVHFHTLGQLSPAAIRAIGTTPAVMTVHGPEPFLKELLVWYFAPECFRGGEIDRKTLTVPGRVKFVYYSNVQRPLYRRLIERHVQMLIAPSRYIENVVRREGLRVPVRHLPNGIALPKVEPTNRESRRVLFVGRLEQVKGVHILLEAVARILSTGNPVALDIVGDGPARQNLTQQTHALGIAHAVTFHGWLHGQALIDRYRESRVVAIPSICPENFPTVCIEALATGRPVVCSATGGSPELVQDGVTGWVVPVGNVSALSAALEEALQSNAERMAKATRASVEELNVERFVNGLLEIYLDSMK